jgi:putative transposase
MDYETLSHSKWDCKYHVVFIPKYRRKALYTELRKHLGVAFKTLAEQKESRIEYPSHSHRAGGYCAYVSVGARTGKWLGQYNRSVSRVHL